MRDGRIVDGGLLIVDVAVHTLILSFCHLVISARQGGVVPKRQFQDGEATIEWRRPRVAARGDGASGRNEQGRWCLINASGEEMDAGFLCGVDDNGVRVGAHRFQLAVGGAHCGAGG